MIQEALQYLVELGSSSKPTEQMQVNGRLYTNDQIFKVEEPLVTSLSVSTLSGLADLLGPDCKFEAFDAGTHLVHVVNHLLVQVVTKRSNDWKNREVLVEAKPTDTKGFQFDVFLAHEAFVIGLQAGFVDAGDRERALKIASNVTGEAVVVSADDGVSQAISVKQSVVLKDSVTIRTVKLAPYRTFREVEQPVSDFILRARQEQEGAIPKLALFEADGGKWKLEAVESVARNLRAALPGVVVVS